MEYTYRTFFQNLYRMQKQIFAFKAQDQKEAAAWQETFRDALSEKLGLRVLEQIAGKAGQRNAVLLSECRKEGYRCRKYVLETLPEVFMPFYMLIPDGVDESRPARGMIAVPAHGANKNTVCGIGETPEEKKKIAEVPRECYGQEFVRQGYVVFAPDPPGYGERIEKWSIEDQYFLGDRESNSLGRSCKDLSQTAEAMGLSLTALEIYDLKRLLDFACGCEEVKKQDGKPVIGCAGFSGGGQYSMWLAAMDERICLAVVSGYIHGIYDCILECHLCSCNFAPDLWKFGDISDICSLIAPRPLFVESGTEDVENGPGGLEESVRQVQKIRKAYELFHAEEKLVHSIQEGEHQWYGSCYEFCRSVME